MTTDNMGKMPGTDWFVAQTLKRLGIQTLAPPFNYCETWPVVTSLLQDTT